MYKALNKLDTTYIQLASGDIVTAAIWNNLNRFYIEQSNYVVDAVNLLQVDVTRLEERYKHLGIYYGTGEAPDWAYLQIVPTGDEGISLITWRDALAKLKEVTDDVQTALDSGALVGPRGEKGDKGDKGAKGDKGDTGAVTYGALTPEQKQDLIAEGIRMCAEVAAGVTTIEQNHLKPLQFWVGTQDEYNALSEKKEGTFYIISDDTTYEGLIMKLQQLETKLEQLEAQFTAHFATI